ncbi:MAG TPA: lamin tail domain-containing protein, partial [Verrucomicrobiota bacterium]|nr:lamin tail domain-containing protein [Verrucomicrobiota bacterium]
MNLYCYFVRGGLILAISGFMASGLCSDVIISEFMASNSRTIADEDGSYEDWIEIYNNGTNNVNLGGWYLTDSKKDLTKWMFPSTNLNAGAYLVVFASGKDRRIAGRNLHTNFKLSASGEYLGLIEPDGITIATEFSPSFPPQFADVSYGCGQESQYQKVVNSNSLVKILIPTNDALGLVWTGAELFDDSSWLTGTNGVGFDTGIREVGETYADLKNYYPFENNAIDSIGGVSGSLNGSPGFTAGRSGQAISLNGSSQFISLSALNYPTKFSINVWVKPIQKDNIMTVSASSGGGSATAGFRFFINRYQTSDGLINFETGDGSAGAVVRSLYPVNWGEWNNIIVVVDRAAGRGKILLNGVDVTSPT